jgi:hypothetical protein
MIEHFTVFDKGGVVLWSYTFSKLKTNAINELISRVLLEVRLIYFSSTLKPRGADLGFLATRNEAASSPLRTKSIQLSGHLQMNTIWSLLYVLNFIRKGTVGSNVSRFFFGR